MSDTKYHTGFTLNFERSKQASENEAQIRANKDTPFSIAILGDFSGRANEMPIGKRRFIEIDRDNIDEVLSSLDITLQLKLHETSSETIIRISEMDEFHPDQLYENVESFSQLRSLRRRLKNKNTFAEAAKEIQGWLISEEKVVINDNVDDSLSTENLFESVIASSSALKQAETSISGSTMVDDLVKQIIAPHVEPSTDPRQDEMLAAVDEAISSHMQFILHHPAFQAMEAAWESVWFLIKRIETGQTLKLYLLDVSRQALADDLVHDSIATTELYKLFCDRAPGDVSWSLLLGNYTFNDKVEDILLLSQLGAIAQQAQAPFFAAANETLVGCESFAVTPDVDDWQHKIKPGVDMAWRILRQSSAAEYIGLVLPHFLLRTPYGQKSKPIEAFTFEEMPELHCHSCYLWGNGAFVKVEQLARAFMKQGWQLTTADISEMDNLPTHYFMDDGEMVTKPCVEIQLTEQGGLKIHHQGLIPLWSVKNTDRIRSSEFHSLAESGRKIIG